MFNIDKILKDFLKRFDNTTIGPTDWDRVVSKFNFAYMLIEVLVIIALSSSILYMLLPIPFKWIGIISVIIAGVRVAGHFKKFKNFLEVPVGKIGIILLLGDKKGSMEDGDRYYLQPGKYRDFINIIFYKDIFNIILPPIQFDNFDYNFEDVFTKDGVALKGTHTGRPKLVNPYAWVDLLLSTGDEKIHYKKIEDISLEAMNEAADDDLLSAILKVGDKNDDGSDNFKRNYIKELNRLSILIPPKRPFLDNEGWNADDYTINVDGKKMYTTFYFPQTGLNITFNIKTRAPMDPEARKSLSAETIATENAKAIKIEAEAEKNRLKIEGEGKAEADKAMNMATQEVFMKSLKEILDELMDEGEEITKEVRDQAILHAALSANQYAHETLSSIGSSDGSPLNSGLSIEKMFALAQTFFEKRDKEKK